MKFILIMLFCLTTHAETILIGDGNACGDTGHQMQLKRKSSLTCMPGSGPVYWAKHLPALNSESKIIVVLGEVDLNETHLDPSYQKLAKAIAKKTKHCEWVGPDSKHKNIDNFYSELNKKVKPCTVTDSRKK